MCGSGSRMPPFQSKLVDARQMTAEERTKEPTKEELQAARLLRVATIVLAAVLVLGITILVFFSVWFHDAELSHKPEHWGQTGDFIGGLVNPTVGLGTVVLIFIGLRIQRAELKATTTQLEKANEHAKIQGFEQSLFSWLANYHSLLSAITAGPNFEGRRALTKWYEDHFIGYRARLGRRGPIDVTSRDIAQSKLVELTTSASTSDPDHLQLGSIFLWARRGYIEMFDKHRVDLDAVLRTLFRLFQWIDESGLPRKQRWHYAALVRAQLSWVELAYLFYNACSDEGAPFATYVNKYALLDNLVGGHDLLIKAARDSLVHTSPALQRGTDAFVWPLEPEAFSSGLAKLKFLHQPD